MLIDDVLVVHAELSVRLADERRENSAVGGMVAWRKSSDIKLGGWCPTCHAKHGMFTWKANPMAGCSQCGINAAGKQSMVEYAKALLKTH
jgi:hypothetical protein